MRILIIILAALAAAVTLTEVHVKAHLLFPKFSSEMLSDNAQLDGLYKLYENLNLQEKGDFEQSKDKLPRKPRGITEDLFKKSLNKKVRLEFSYESNPHGDVEKFFPFHKKWLEAKDVQGEKSSSNNMKDPMSISFEKAYKTEGILKMQGLEENGGVDVCAQKDPPAYNVAGYAHFEDFDENNPVDRKLFFWIFHSRNDFENDPVIIWLNGGPGCSSLIGLFTENGPCKIMEVNGNTSTFPNEYSWNEFATIIYIDQPVGVGFSINDEPNVVDTDQAAIQFYLFIQSIYNEFPVYRNLPLHIAGESYAGHYVPSIAQLLLIANDSNDSGLQIPLKSILLGNPIVNALYQATHFGEMAIDGPYKFIDISGEGDFGNLFFYDNCIETLSGLCSLSSFHTNENCAFINHFCWSIGVTIASDNHRSVYDIREHCDQGVDCQSDKTIKILESHVNSPGFTEAVGIVPKINFQACNADINFKFLISGDFNVDYDTEIAYLLNRRLPVLVYAGNTDFICNWKGNFSWVKSLKWTYSDLDQSTGLTKIDQNSIFYGVDGEQYIADKLTFLVINEAGHMVPSDQPFYAFTMVKAWVNSIN